MRFDQLFTEGQRASGRYFRVCSLPGTGLVGIATAKNLGCHARRNRQRRRARAAVNALGTLDVGLDMAVLVRDGADKVGIDDLTEDLRRLLEETRRRWAGSSE